MKDLLNYTYERGFYTNDNYREANNTFIEKILGNNELDLNVESIIDNNYNTAKITGTYRYNNELNIELTMSSEKESNNRKVLYFFKNINGESYYLEYEEYKTKTLAELGSVDYAEIAGYVVINCYMHDKKGNYKNVSLKEFQEKVIEFANSIDFINLCIINREAKIMDHEELQNK